MKNVDQLAERVFGAAYAATAQRGVEEKYVVDFAIALLPYAEGYLNTAEAYDRGYEDAQNENPKRGE